ncbi:sirohydrochlorin chelatase [Terrilactibacillus sp. BCM23-1]|uniref:Sirohydrochlorin chelatase n=2 Tax=Terrilactibacillus tamarindi TaxID=2599694 RepID=A0A6N8CPX7_9BACI|nr:sirohydrochlorin chelatase [Terrilactibacillus tamarindi]
MDKQGVLYVSHGSRDKEALREAEQCIKMAQKQVQVPLQEICYLEISKPDIFEGMEKLVKRGATRVAIVPVLLLSAGHYYKDIPKAIEDIKCQYPFVTLTYGKPLGVQDRLIDVLVDRLKEAEIPHLSKARLLLVGRGSRNPETRRDIEKIASMLKERSQVKTVDVCYLAVLKPSFNDVLNHLDKLENETVIILPYLWFTGLLIKSMEKKIESLNTTNKLVLCQYLGLHPNMADALSDRVKEAILSTPVTRSKLDFS